MAKVVADIPPLLEQWDFSVNTEDPYKITYGSGKRVWWVCEYGHKWAVSVNSRTNYRTGCPFCAGVSVGYGNDLLTVNAELCLEWDYDRNSLGPDTVTPGSSKKAHWVCGSSGHRYTARIADRARRGRGCPYCSGHRVAEESSLAITHPELACSWDFEKNIVLPSEVSAGSERKVWWCCPSNHSWKAVIFNRSRGHGCPYCASQMVDESNSLLARFPSIAAEWDYHKNKKAPSQVTGRSGQYAWWRCSIGHSWKALISNRTAGRGCPECAVGKKSKVSQEWLDSLQIPNLLREYRIDIGSSTYFVDGFDPSTNTVYEFLGDYWHGNPNVPKFRRGINKHNGVSFKELYKLTQEKLTALRSAGFSVVSIWEDEYRSSAGS